MGGKKHNPNMATIQAQIERLVEETKGHNKRLDDVDKRLAVVENDMGWVKRGLKQIDTRVWFILGGIVISILVAMFK